MDKGIYVAIFLGALLGPFIARSVTSTLTNDADLYSGYYIWGSFFGPMIAALMYKIYHQLKR